MIGRVAIVCRLVVAQAWRHPLVVAQAWRHPLVIPQAWRHPLVIPQARRACRDLLIASSLIVVAAAGPPAIAEPQAPSVTLDSTRRSRTSADTALEELTRRVAAQLRCPVCQGLSLADSPSELALEMKDVVRTQLAAGRTPDEVKGYFVAKYGEWILLEPPRRGVNLLAYALPAIAVGAGLFVIWLALRKWTCGAPSPEDVAASNQDR